MDGFRIYRNGQYYKKGQEISKGNYMHCLASEQCIEVIKDIMPKGTTGFIHGVPNNSTFDLVYIIKGAIILYDLEQAVVLRAGDYYMVKDLENDLLFKVTEDYESLYINNQRIYQDNLEYIKILNEILDEIQKADGDTSEHCKRVANLTMGIAYILKFQGTQLGNLFLAAKFHDVGKCKIPVELLQKPAKLTDEEYEIMKLHSIYTYEILLEYLGNEVAAMADGHHERLDGMGYPNGFSGDQISLASRIICVADAYDAMTVTRPYRKGMTREEAFAELRRCQGTQFDPIVIDALEEYLIKEEKLFSELE